MGSNDTRYFLDKGTVIGWWPRVLNSIVMRRYSQKLIEIINANDKDEIILDAGVGTGIHAIGMAKEAPCVVGLDLSRDLINICAKNSEKRIALVLGDIQNMPFKSASFSKVVCVRTLVHVPSYKRAIHELLRMTKPGGLLIVENDNLFHISRIFSEVVYIFVKHVFRRNVAPNFPRTPNSILNPFKKSSRLILVYGFFVALPAFLQALGHNFGGSYHEPLFSKLGQHQPINYLGSTIVVKVQKLETEQGVNDIWRKTLQSSRQTQILSLFRNL